MRRVRSSPYPPRPRARDDGSGNSSLAIEAWARSLDRVICGPSQRAPVRATSSPAAAPITAEHKAARLRRASIASDARRRFRKQEGMPMTDTVALRQPWYRGLNRHQWNILLAANLGWLFDGFELYALFLTVGPAMRSLLEPPQYPQIPAYIGTVVAITLLGWGIGGIVGGVLADYIGRKRTMILAILAYSITTGLTAISFVDIVCDSALPRRHCHRIGMGDRLVDDGRAVARPR